MRTRHPWLFRAVIALMLLVALGLGGGAVVWWKFFQSRPQIFASDTDRFAHGSLGGDLITGIPYSIFMILPRVFPDLVARYATEGFGPDKAAYGGYGAFGLAWAEGDAVPLGISVKHIGYDRVTVNCALCHTASWRLSAHDDPHFAIGGPGHTVNVQGLVRFLFAASHDRRFSATRLLPEIALNFPMDWLDWAIMGAVIIPQTRAELRFAETQFAWMNQRPAWGPGRDDAFNLPKFILTRSAPDDSVSNTDFPGLWRMANRDGQLMHAAGEAHTLYAVTATSALGTGALPAFGFHDRNEWIGSYLRTLEPPPWPLPIDPTLAARGSALFREHCAECHAADGKRVGSAIPLDEIGTDPAHVLAWTQPDAERMNRLTGLLGMDDAKLQAAQGYVARPLVGVWLLGPYLHNGSVPTLRDLLSPPAARPAVFHRGYDVIDHDSVGFEATGADAERHGFRFDTSLKGNGNGGHAYGTDLPEEDRRALIEFLKTL